MIDDESRAWFPFLSINIFECGHRKSLKTQCYVYEIYILCESNFHHPTNFEPQIYAKAETSLELLYIECNIKYNSFENYRGLRVQYVLVFTFVTRTNGPLFFLMNKCS